MVKFVVQDWFMMSIMWIVFEPGEEGVVSVCT
jgi:hypothetical protein